MDTFAVILLVVSAATLTVAACLFGLMLSRRLSHNVSTFRYPVPDDGGPGSGVPVLEEDAEVYNVAEKKAAELMERFKAYMAEQKPYLAQDVSIDTIANSLGTNKTTLSKMINGRFGMNFRQLLNSYRVKEAVDLFTNDNKLSMEDLRKGAGFNSVSTFISSFSRFTGFTPAEYCKRVASH